MLFLFLFFNLLSPETNWAEFEINYPNCEYKDYEDCMYGTDYMYDSEEEILRLFKKAE